MLLCVGAQVLSRRTPFIIFVPGNAYGLLAEVLRGPVHGSAQKAITTTRHIVEVFALNASVLNSESIGVIIHVCSIISIQVKLFGDETRWVPAR